ncbi:hypothetical protein C8T65DRAFT_698307 [Cerioporus squamosus]|nr:hypothetical protein C8T65DRAFT_698307 [Cerioporus squamosus]
MVMVPDSAPSSKLGASGPTQRRRCLPVTTARLRDALCTKHRCDSRVINHSRAMSGGALDLTSRRKTLRQEDSQVLLWLRDRSSPTKPLSYLSTRAPKLNMRTPRSTRRDPPTVANRSTFPTQKIEPEARVGRHVVELRRGLQEREREARASLVLVSKGNPWSSEQYDGSSRALRASPLALLGQSACVGHPRGSHFAP